MTTARRMGVRQQARIISLALLILALVTPALFLAGYAVNGQELFSRSTARVVVALVGAGLGAGAAAYLALRRDALGVRIVAGLALVALIGSMLFVRVAWGQSMSRAIEQLRRLPFDVNETGVLICPADHSVAASREARELQTLFERTVAGAGLEERIQVQIGYPVSDEAQARVLATDRRATVVIWKRTNTYHGRVTESYHVTSPGVATNTITAQPLDLLVVMLLDRTFDLERTYDPEATGIWPLARETIAPLAIGIAFWSADDPLLAATLFNEALSGNDGLDSQEQAELHEYLAAAMLALGRPDLAETHLAAAVGPSSQSSVAVAAGAVSIARREWDDAERAFMHALEIDPSCPAAYSGLSAVLATKLDAERAVQAAQQAVALDDASPVPYAFLGMALERTGAIDAAAQSYQRAAIFSGGNLGLYSATSARAQAVRSNPPTAVPTATVRPTPSITPYPTAALYEVESGDTLAKIAEQFGVTVDEIMEINKITNRNAIAVGDKLKIPAKLD